jgi:hypothetical protein
LHLIIVVKLFPSERWRNKSQWSPESHLLPVRSAWETSAQNPSVSFCDRNAPHIWWDFGLALPFQTRLTQTEPVLPLSNEHGSQVKDQGRRSVVIISIKNFPIGLHVMYLYFLDMPRIFLFLSCWPAPHACEL